MFLSVVRTTATSLADIPDKIESGTIDNDAASSSMELP
jgi:hypothetical protein